MDNNLFLGIAFIVTILSLWFLWKKLDRGEEPQSKPLLKKSNTLQGKMDNLFVESLDNKDDVQPGALISDNLKAFIDNVTQSPTTMRKGNDFSRELKNYSEDIFKQKYKIYDGEVRLSPEEKAELLDCYKGTSFAWMIPISVGFTESGKIRVPFSIISHLTAELEPIMLPDATMKVLNMFSFEEGIAVALKTGKPMFMQDSKGEITEITSEMVSGLVHDTNSLSKLHMDNLRNDYNKKDELVKKLEKSYRETVEPLKAKSEELKKENLELSKKASSASEAIEMLNARRKEVQEKDSEILTLLDEIKSLKSANSSKDAKFKELTDKFENKIENKKEARVDQQERDTKRHHNTNNIEAIPLKTKTAKIGVEAKSEQMQTDAITSVKSKTQKIQEDNSGYSHCLRIKFIESLVAKIEATALNERQQIGLISVTQGSTQNEKVLIFLRDEFQKLLTDWVKEENCYMYKFKFNNKLKYLVDPEKRNIYFGDVIQVFAVGNEIKVDQGVSIYSDTELKKLNSKTNRLLSMLLNEKQLPINQYFKKG